MAKGRPRASKSTHWVFSGLRETAPVPPGPKKAARGPKDPVAALLPKQSAPSKWWTQGRLRASKLDLLPPPEIMTAATIGRAASAAAREVVGPGPVFWTALGERAVELLPSMDPEDLTLVLQAMCRVRQLNEGFVRDACRSSERRLKYFSTKHLTMLLAALARMGVEEKAVLQEFRGRVPELRGAGTLTMAVVALARMQLSEPEFIHEVGRQVDARLSADRFHVRDVAAVSGAYMRLRHMDETHMAHLITCGTATISEAAPRELAAVVLAACTAKVASAHETAALAAEIAAEQAPFMLPHEVVDAVFAFGSALEVAGEEVHELLGRLVMQAVRDVKCLEGREVARLLQSCARWALPISPEDVKLLAEEIVLQREGLQVATSAKALRALVHMLEGEEEPLVWQAAKSLDEQLRRGIADCAAEALAEAVEATYMFEVLPCSQGRGEEDAAALPLSQALSKRLEGSTVVSAEKAVELHARLEVHGGCAGNAVLSVLHAHAKRRSSPMG